MVTVPLGPAGPGVVATVVEADVVLEADVSPSLQAAATRNKHATTDVTRNGILRTMHDLFLVQPAWDRTYGTVSVSTGSRACAGSTTTKTGNASSVAPSVVIRLADGCDPLTAPTAASSSAWYSRTSLHGSSRSACSRAGSSLSSLDLLKISAPTLVNLHTARPTLLASAEASVGKAWKIPGYVDGVGPGQPAKLTLNPPRRR